ncbi:hypothetical protein RF656_21860 [Yersinia kristensenii]|uniref:hypothetical protein n=1 Tax=Yersinia kristensenii TaxID=28152 RepID=UPI00285310BD|nr:hypothetical protein [Yersinia kristensenii]MDR4899357.1 hypothetical protein [Yersinia kristensenii]
MMKYIYSFFISMVFFSPLLNAAEYKLTVPSDSKAEYTVLSKGTQGDLKTIVTKRSGSSGVSYSERAYDCNNHTVKYLGSGDTLEQMKASGADKNMGEIFTGSIADFVGREACK